MKELSLTHIVLLYLAGINMVTFFMYGIDKWRSTSGRLLPTGRKKAKKSKWRIRETSLLAKQVPVIDYEKERNNLDSNIVEAVELLIEGINEKPAEIQRVSILWSGERGIRTPGTSRYDGFQDRCNRPLYHLSFNSLPLWRL